MKYHGILALAALAAVAATQADAAIIIHTSPGAIQPADNVLFANLGPAATITASTNHGPLNAVSFSGTETLATFAGGQARISGVDGTIDALNLQLADPMRSITQIEFLIDELNGRGAPANVTATIRFFDQNNVATSIIAYPLAPGNDWFSAETTLGSLIRRVEIQTSANVGSFKQFRLAGEENPTGAVPEPTTWALLILGFGMIGGALRRRRGARLHA